MSAVQMPPNDMDSCGAPRRTSYSDSAHLVKRLSSDPSTSRRIILVELSRVAQLYSHLGVKAIRLVRNPIDLETLSPQEGERGRFVSVLSPRSIAGGCASRRMKGQIGRRYILFLGHHAG